MCFGHEKPGVPGGVPGGNEFLSDRIVAMLTKLGPRGRAVHGRQVASTTGADADNNGNKTD